MFKILLLLLMVNSIYGATKSTLFSFTMEKPFGSTWYDLEYTGKDTTTIDGTVKPMIRSALTFPQDHVRINLGLISWRQMEQDSLVYLYTKLKLWSGIGPAWTKMRDEDWVGINTSSGTSKSTALLKFSDTYSEIESFLFGGELNREFKQIHFLRKPFILGFGIEGSFFSCDIFGLSGKQLYTDSITDVTEWRHFTIPDNIKVGTYRTYDIQTSINFRSQERIFGLFWENQFHPLIFASSLDDHILRSKHIEMNTWGLGNSLEASLPLKLGPKTNSPVACFIPFIRGEFSKTWGKQTQTYYANSTDTPEDETGTSFGGISTTVNHWLISLGIHINFN